jgi:sugar phosphate permease
MDRETEKPKIFYGWYVLAIGMFGAFLGAGTSQVFMSTMLKPLTEEFGWSRTIATGAITTGTILAGFFSFPFGKLADRYGPRLLTSLGALLVACTYVAMTKFATLWQFYVIYVIARVVTVNTLSSVVPQTAVVNWFRRYRGRALGLLSMATPLGASVLAFTAQLIMEQHGWRTVFVSFAFAMGFLEVIPAALVLRRRPEDLGLVPDGINNAHVAPASTHLSPAQGEAAWTVGEAIRTRTLWLLITAIVIALTVNTGVGFHLVAYYTDVGIVPSAAVGALSIYALTGAVANAIWGFLSERLPERILASVVMILTAVAILYLQTVRTIPSAFLFAVLFGFTSRGEGTLVNIILAQYFGRSSYGAISGFVYPFNMIAMGFGPLICSLGFDLTGSYQMFFSVFITVSLISALLFWLARKPTPPAGGLRTHPPAEI